MGCWGDPIGPLRREKRAFWGALWVPQSHSGALGASRGIFWKPDELAALRAPESSTHGLPGKTFSGTIAGSKLLGTPHTTQTHSGALGALGDAWCRCLLFLAGTPACAGLGEAAKPLSLGARLGDSSTRGRAELSRARGALRGQLRAAGTQPHPRRAA